MTRINRVKFEGLRARDRELDLAPLTLLQGSMGCGKTSVVDAIRILFCGHVPSIGKNSLAVSRLMRNGVVRVEAAFDDGRSAVRGYQRDRDRLSEFAMASWMPPKSGMTEVSEEIQKLIGRDGRQAAEHMDLRQLLDCTPAERGKRIEELLDASGIPADEAATRIAALAFLRAADVHPDKMPDGIQQLETAATGVRGLLDEGAAKRLDEEVGEIHSLVSVKGIAGAIDEIRAQKSEASEAVKRRREARAVIEDRIKGLRVPSDAVDTLERRRDEAVAAIATADEERKAAAERAEERAKVAPAIGPLEEARATAATHLDVARAALQEADTAEAEAEAVADPPELEAPPQVQVDEAILERAQTLLTEAKALDDEDNRLADEASAIETPDAISVAEEKSAYLVAVQERTKSETSPWREVESIAQALRKELGESHRVAEHIGRLDELATEHGGDREALVKAEREAGEALAEAEKRQEARDAEIKEAIGRIGSLREKASEARKEAHRLATERLTILAQGEEAAKGANEEARAEYARAVADRAVAIDENQTRRRELVEKAKSIRASATEAQAALDKAEADLRAAKERLAGIDSVPAKDIAEIEARLAAATAEKAELDDKLEAVRGAAELRQEMKRIAREIDRATHRFEALKAIEWACQRVKELDMASRAGGLEARMRRYLKAAGRDEEPYLRASRGVCDFGWRRGDQEISVEALSGGETVIFCATLAAAIIAIRKPAARILLVEAAEVGVVADSLFEACTAMVESGDIDQILVASCTPLTAPEAWKTIDLGSEVSPVKALAS